LPKEILHNFNWTFTTEYKGSLKEHSDSGFEKNATDKLNLEKLMQKENILFYEDIMLFEDELHDNGISNCTVKIVSNYLSQVYYEMKL
jgi:type 2A phosphatase activator TIP41